MARHPATLQEGKNLVLGGTAAEPRGLGAIRARAECIRCHEAKVGDVLGAFTYDLEPMLGPKIDVATDEGTIKTASNVSQQ